HEPLERAAHPVAQRPLASGTVVHRGILPECAGFVDDGDAEAPAHPECGKTVENGRMRVYDLRTLGTRHVADPAGEPPHEADLARDWHAPGRPTQGAKVRDPVALLAQGGRGAVLRRSDDDRPEPRRLLEHHDI